MNAKHGNRLDFKFVDGLRAIAAIAVALLHACLFTGNAGDVARDMPLVLRVFSLGNYAVPMFIVLSGFVLMLPIAQTSELRLKRGTANYLIRRARRILPPYYASLALFGLLILVVPALSRQQNTAWDSKIPVTISGVVSHVFVVHNLDPDWIYQINGPAWSVATEWQLYFALPFLLLPVWRKFGRLAMLLVALVVGIAVTVLFPSLDGAHFWFIGLFAMGGLAAQATVTDRTPPWLGTATSGAWGLSAAVIGFASVPMWVSETITGAAIALLVLWLARRQIDERKPPVNRVLESKFLVWAGTWSYSLYLIHSPLLGLGNLMLLDQDMSTPARLAVQMGIVLPLAAGAAYLFHLLVERRFMTSHQKQVSTQKLDPQRPVEVQQPR